MVMENAAACLDLISFNVALLSHRYSCACLWCFCTRFGHDYCFYIVRFCSWVAQYSATVTISIFFIELSYAKACKNKVLP